MTWRRQEDPVAASRPGRKTYFARPVKGEPAPAQDSLRAQAWKQPSAKRNKPRRAGPCPPKEDEPRGYHLRPSALSEEIASATALGAPCREIIALAPPHVIEFVERVGKFGRSSRNHLIENEGSKQTVVFLVGRSPDPPADIVSGVIALDDFHNHQIGHFDTL